MTESKCRGDELGYSDECDELATQTIKVDGEQFQVCDECYETADAYRTARWEHYYNNR
jgi:hypothetical protein